MKARHVPSVIYGSRPDGHAKVMLELAQACGGFRLLGAIDDTVPIGTIRVNGLEVLGGKLALSGLRERGVEAILFGFGDGASRYRLLKLATSEGLAAPSLIHPDAWIGDSAALGPGAQLLESCVLESGCSLGSAVLVYPRCVIGAGADLAAGVTLAPGSLVGAGARIGEGSSVGAGATVLPGVNVGKGVTVGAGAIVTEAVADGRSAVGVPARTLERPKAPR